MVSISSKKERRIIGTFVLGISLFGLFQIWDDGLSNEQSLRRSLLGEYAGTTRKRIALIRPFGPSDSEKLLSSFNLWDTRWPCVVDDEEYEVDLILSYSRAIKDGFHDDLMSNFVNKGGWSECFGALRVISSNLDPSQDKYERSSTGEPVTFDWVSGPNGQFRASMSDVMNVKDPVSNKPYYDLAMIMEWDNQPTKTGWLNELLQDVKDNAPFTILGSKYKGSAWDGMAELMPASLVNHINGNAFYNLTSSYFKSILEELYNEADTPYNSIPYDYRISQMLYEGHANIPPEFPFPWITYDDGSKVVLHSKKAKMRQMFKNGRKEALGQNPVKEGNSMANFADSNYLPDQVKGDPALIHGLQLFKPHDPETHPITLVVSAWDDRSDHASVITEMDKSSHPFQEVIILENPRWDVFNHHKSILDAERPKISIPVKLQERVARDITDVCDAPVNTEWFVHTNAHHRVADSVDLLFTQENPVSRPVVPYTPAESFHCGQYPACQETLRIAREIYPELDKVVLDMNIPYHKPSRDSFCKFWKSMYGENGEILEAREAQRRLTHNTPITPTATAYVAYLYKTGLAENLYMFTNVLLHGSKPSFVRIRDDDEYEFGEVEENDVAESSPELERKRLQKGEESQVGGRGRRLAKGGNGGGGGGSPPPPSPTTPPSTCAINGEGASSCGSSGGNLPDSCCSGFTCGSVRNKVVCVISPTVAPTHSPVTQAPTGGGDPYGGGRRTRRLSLSRPGLLVEG